jgi:adhesin transport system outer membrane protein
VTADTGGYLAADPFPGTGALCALEPGGAPVARAGIGLQLDFLVATGVGLAAAAGVAFAQSAAEPAVLTLRHAVNQAVLRHPSRVRAGHEITAAGYQRDAAEWGRYPTLSVDAAPRLSSGDTAVAPTNVVRLEQPLWAGGRIDASIDAARSQVSAAESAEGETRQRLAERAALAYVGWVHAMERVEIGRAGDEQLSRLVRYVRRRQQEGVASAADVSIANARHGNVLAKLTALRGALDKARAELEAVTVLTRFERGVPVEVPRYTEDAQETERKYLENSPLVAQRRVEVDNARAQALVRRSSMFPRFAVRLEHLSGASGALGVLNESRMSLVMQYLPDAGFASYSGYQAAASRIEAAQAQVDADENDARLRSRSNWSDYSATRVQVGELQAQLKALESAAESFMRQFEAGRKSWLEVVNTYLEVIDTRIALSQAISARDQSALRLVVNAGSFWPWLESLPQ